MAKKSSKSKETKGIGKSFEKVRASILSCRSKEQLKNARKMAIYFYRLFEDNEMYESIRRIYDVKMGEFEWF